MTLKKVLSALLILQMVSSQLTFLPPTGIYIDKATLSSANQTNIYYTSITNSSLTPMTNSSAITFQVGWRNTLSNVIYSGMGLENFNFGATAIFMSYIVEFKNVSTYGAQIQLQCYGANSQFLFVTFGIIIVTQNNNYLELITYKNSLNILNDPAADTQSFNATSSKFYFNNNAIISSFLLMQWVTGQIIVGSFTQNIYIYSYNINLSPFVNISVYSFSGYNNIYHSFKVNILLINKAFFQPSSAITTYDIGTSTISPNFGVSSMFGSPLFSGTCLMGIPYITKDDSINTYLYFNINGQTVTSLVQNFYGFSLRGICFGMCPVPYVYSQNAGYTCQLCKNYISNCYSCVSIYQCTQCLPSSYLASGKSSCMLCRQYMYNCKTCTNQATCIACYTGNLVIGGCTDVVGCSLVTQYTMQNDRIITLCNQCQNQYILDVSNQICVCKVGWSVGPYCTTMRGCISIVKNVTGLDCLFCNTTALFHRNPTTHECQCKAGFYLNGDNCSQICGDGMLYTLQCDDGNLVDGDGCSHTCEPEIFYQCSKTSPSVCQFYGLSIIILLTNIQKKDNKNQGIFTFSFNPELRGLEKMNISNYFYFSCSASLYRVAKWVYSNGTASVYVDYQQRLQGKSATVNFTFDQFYVHHSQVSIDFSMISHGSKLIFYGRQNQQLINMGYILFGASLLAIFILLFGSWFHRMVGVQLVQTLQIVYYLQFVIYDYSQADSIYQYLSLVGLNNYFSDSNSINLAINKQFQIIGFSYSSTELSLLFLMIVVTICAFSLIVIALFQSNNPSIRNFCFIISSKILSNILFPITFSIIVPFFLIIISLQQHQYPVSETLMSPKLRAASIFLLFAIYSIIFNKLGFQVKYYKSILEKSIFKEAKIEYIFLYKCISLLITIIILVLLQFELVVMLYSFLFCYIYIFIWQIIQKPYASQFDNFGIILNSSLIITFLIYVCLRKFQYISTDQTGSILVNLIIVCWIVLCSAISLIRIIKEVIKTRRNSCSQKVKKSINKDSNDGISSIKKKLNEEYNRINKRTKILQNENKDRQNLLGQEINYKRQQQRSQFKPIIQKYRQMFRKKQLNTSRKVQRIQ